MQLIRGKEHLKGNQYAWMRISTSPQKFVQGSMDVTHIVCAVAGTRPLVYGPTIWGNLPGKEGVISYYTRSEGVYELAKLTDGIHYYWARYNTKRSRDRDYYTMPTLSEKPRATIDEPWHAWSNQEIADRIYAICEDYAISKEPIDQVCLRHGINHFGFDSLFQQRWPYEYAVWKKSKKIPERSSLAYTGAERAGLVPILEGH